MSSRLPRHRPPVTPSPQSPPPSRSPPPPPSHPPSPRLPLPQSPPPPSPHHPSPLPPHPRRHPRPAPEAHTKGRGPGHPEPRACLPGGPARRGAATSRRERALLPGAGPGPRADDPTPQASGDNLSPFFPRPNKGALPSAPGPRRRGRGAWRGGSADAAAGPRNTGRIVPAAAAPPPRAGGLGPGPGSALPAPRARGARPAGRGHPAPPQPRRAAPRPTRRRAGAPGPPPPRSPRTPAPARGARSGRAPAPAAGADRGEPGPAARPRNPGIAPEGGSHWWLTVFGNHRNQDLTYIFEYGLNPSFPSRNQRESDLTCC